MLAISGASGAAYALRLLEQLLLADGASAEVHLVASDYGRRLLLDETGVRQLTIHELVPHLINPSARPPFAPPIPCRSPECHPADLQRHIEPPSSSPPLCLCASVLKNPPPPPLDADQLAARLFVHPHKDVGAVIASGSFLHDGMAVMPCSSASLGGIATGSGSNLLVRAAMVTLKERRPLIVCHRETPLSLIDIENMRTLTLAGAIVCPTNPGFYLLPTTVNEVVDFMVGKVLDLLRVPHTLNTRWERAASSSRVGVSQATDE